MSGPQDRWASLPPEKRSRLEARLKGESPPSLGVGGIVPARDHSRAPLSYAQERLWFLDQLHRGDVSLNRPWALRLRGRLDRHALEASIGEIVRRHEVLRTTFGSEEGQPFQSVQRPRRLRIPITRLVDQPESERLEKARQLARRALQVPFDLETDLLIRPELIRLSDTDNILLLTAHHSGFDGWSEKVFLDELGILYQAYVSSRTSPLADLELQYCDYACWQRERLQGAVLQRLLQYWAKELEGYDPEGEFASRDARRMPVRADAGRMAVRLLPRELLENLNGLARREDATLFMLLLAGFNLLLLERPGFSDQAVGILVAGRTVPQLEGLIGFFVNTLVLRSRLHPAMSFLQLLHQVRQKTLSALAHQELPYARLVEHLRPKRRGGHAALVDHVIQLRNLPASCAALPGMEVEPFEFDPGIAIHDLSLSLEEAAQGLSCKVHYRTSAYSEGEIDGILERFGGLLEAAVADPSRSVGELASVGLPPPAVRKKDLGERFTAPSHFDRSNLTRSQLLIWAGEQLRPNTPLYSIPYAFRIQGLLDPLLFKQAFRELAVRSDALRSVIVEEDGLPLARVLPNIDCDIEILDFAGLPSAEQALEHWLGSHAQRPFTLSEKLFDTALIRMGREEWVWYLNLHYIIGDAWAIDVIFRQMEDLYRLGEAGQRMEIPDLPSFRQYVEARKERRSSARIRQAERYWQQKLHRPAETLAFYGRDTKPSSAAVRRIVEQLSAERSQRLRDLARGKLRSAKSETASILNAIAAALLAYIRRVTGARQLSLAMPVHNRDSDTARRTIGLLMEVLILRLAVEDGDTFASLAHKVSQEAAESLSHRGFTPGNPERERTYDVTLNMHTGLFGRFAGRPVQTTWLHTGFDEDLLSLRLHDYEGTGSLKLDFEFNREIFSPEQVQRALGHFMALFNALLANPDQDIHSVQILSDDESALVQAANATDAPLAGSGSVISAFEKRAQESPHRTALVEGDSGRSITYGQLNAWAEGLAQKIRSRRMGRDPLVGLVYDRSANTVASLLAIWKAGGAYLPLDPLVPPKRISRILADSGANLLLGCEAALAKLPSLTAGAIVAGDGPEHAAQEFSARRRSDLNDHDLAYVIYTSGSSGEPKGVMVEHGSLSNFNAWSCQAYGLGPEDRVLQFASMSWDTSLEEIAPCLTSGATLILRSEAMLSSYAAFLEECHRLRVSIVMLPTVYWHGLCEFLDSEGLTMPPDVRLVNIGGERASRVRLEQWFRRVGEDVRLVNTYGLTETTAVATMADLSAQRGQDPGKDVPIGRPITHMRAYVLDDHLMPVPFGCRGELYIAGKGLARGYLGDAHLTAQAFLEVSIGSGDKQRILRTGDLATLRPDGQLVCLGRADRQIKIRGHRVQPGEVEDQLLRHPHVRQAAVAALPDDQHISEAGSRLVAYIAPRRKNAEPIPARQLREFLGHNLPEYMLPSAFVFLEDLPLLPGGKVDFQSLPPPEIDAAAHAPAHLPPRDEIEQHLVRVWEETLGIQPIGIQDDFFDLGGHSLLAIQLFTRMEKATRRKLPIQAIFETPTIEGLAARLRGGAITHPRSSLVPLQTEGSRPPIFWIHAAGGLAMSYKRLAGLLGPDQPSYALQAREIDGEGEAAESVERMAGEYISEIRKARPHGPYLLGGLSFGGLVAWEMAQQLVARGEEVPFLALLDTRGPGYPTSLIAKDSLYGLRQRIGFHLGNLSTLEWRARGAYLVTRSRVAVVRYWRRAIAKVSDLVPWRQADLPAASRRSFRAARRARRKYEPTPYPGRVALFRAQIQPGGFEDPLLGWEGMADGGIEVHEVPGAHVSIMSGSRIGVLAEKLRGCLERSQGSGASRAGERSA